jgi:hypothetical protein
MANGSAWSRFVGISSPHDTQSPYSPASIRSRAASICRDVSARN